MIEPALAIRGLAKSFDKPVITGLDLEVATGQLYALLGPNGAGKTTTLRMVTGLTRPDAGTIRIFGIDALRQPLDAKAITAWLPDEPMLYDKLTPSEYLAFVAGLWRMDPQHAAAEAERLLHWLDLWDERDTRCEGFSRGMKQKVALAGALIHDPRLLILDEPLTGLDAGMARAVKDALRAQVDAGKTVIVTTHILEVAERMADRIGIIAGGKLLAEGTLDELRDRAGTEGMTLEDIFIRLTSGA
jgi:ABC-2 type transport system ATP-binding protein